MAAALHHANWNQADYRNSSAGDNYFLAATRPFNQPGKIGFCIVDLYRGHGFSS